MGKLLKVVGANGDFYIKDMDIEVIELENDDGEGYYITVFLKDVNKYKEYVDYVGTESIEGLYAYYEQLDSFEEKVI